MMFTPGAEDDIVLVLFSKLRMENDGLEPCVYDLARRKRCGKGTESSLGGSALYVH